MNIIENFSFIIAKRVEDAEKALAVFPRSSRYNAETGTYEAIVRGVPLLLIYELKSTSEESERVEIIAVFYTARHPNSKPGRRSA